MGITLTTLSHEKRKGKTIPFFGISLNIVYINGIFFLNGSGHTLTKILRIQTFKEGMAVINVRDRCIQTCSSLYKASLVLV